MSPRPGPQSIIPCGMLSFQGFLVEGLVFGVEIETTVFGAGEGEFGFVAELAFIESIADFEDYWGPLVDSCIGFVFEIFVEEGALFFDLFWGIIVCPFLPSAPADQIK